ncbi:MAG TPA: 4,5-DOPA dioxygenase extradiol [Thermohalobaculum sp.]|nr:4,5-DOPA dioxygenase extradiol [Thermohalobaculum sp.]
MTATTARAFTCQLRPSDRMPALFVGHGSPMNAILDNSYSRQWAEIGDALPAPSAILCISAHWMTRGTTLVQVSQKPETIHDFGGFPRQLFEQQYPAPGAPELARATAELLAKHHAEASEEWGLDHGAWSVLIRMFPKADIPVYQLSLDLSLRTSDHFELARDLKSLREQGVLIVASGNMVHNLPAMQSGAEPFDWAVEFDALMADAITGRRFGEIAGADGLGSLMKTAHPTIEHFLPLLYTLAVADDADELNYFNEGIDLGSVSMRSCVFA